MSKFGFPDYVRLHPWRGGRYELGIKRRKVLLVAESCYAWEDEAGRLQGPRRDHVPAMVRSHLNREQMRLLTAIERTFLKAVPDLSSPRQFWDSVALHEYVQRPMASVWDRPTSGDWAAAWDPFRAVVRQFSPDCIFILGYTMWTMLQPSQEPESCVFAAETELWRCGYRFDPRWVTPTYRLRHPSRGYSPEAWAACVARALKLTPAAKGGSA